MKPTRFFSVCCLVVLFLSSLVQAQVDRGELITGHPVTSEIQPSEIHHYQVDLKKDRFAFLRLMQNGMDIVIEVFDPMGNKVGEFDSPNGQNGPEYIAIHTEKKGKYLLEIRPLYKDQSPASYDLAILRIGPEAVTPEDRVDQLFTAWDNQDSPGAAVTVAKDGTIIYSKGFGLSNLEYGIPVTPSTVFHIASVSKQFTVFSVLLLEKAGKLSLDDDIRKYIPEVPDFGKTITLRHLANHTSGLRDQWNLLALAGWRLDDVITTEQILRLISRQKELNFDPGEEYLYCNTGYTLLAEVVKRVSGKSFAAFTDENIFRPLHMTHTLFYEDHEKIIKNRAYSYTPDGDQFKKSVLSYATAGATSLFTTSEDLGLWAGNFAEPVVGDAGIIEKMNERGMLNNGDTIGYALGQGISTYRGLHLISHGGADAGYRSYLGRFPEQGFSVAILSNDGSFDPGSIAMKIADIYLAGQLKSEEVVQQLPVAEKETVAVEVSPDTLDAYTGDYALQPGFVLAISREENHLFIQATGQPRIALRPLSTTAFESEIADAVITFHRDGNNQINLIRLHQGGQVMPAGRIAAFDPGSVELTQYEGNYFSDELLTSYLLSVEDGKLVAHHQRHSNIDLKPVGEDLFSGSAWFFNQVRFRRDENHEITGCDISSGRVRNLRFGKL
jgi:CubicO group peptidase (beta-lactamase class C family)